MIYLKKQEAVNRAKVQFIKENGNIYYSFWVFRTQVLGFNPLNPDTLLAVFNNSFPQKYKLSFEGKRIIDFLEGRKNIRKNHNAPNFSAIDVNGRPISLASYRGKYLLLDFWASWCVPCIEELPVLKDLRNKYPEAKLQIVSFTGDRDTTAFSKAVQKHQMPWIHVFGEYDFKKIYITSGIPQVYLIDPKGRIIYSREEEKDFDLRLLKNLLDLHLKDQELTSTVE